MPRDLLSPLYTKVAKKVLTETLHVQKGESVTVEAWDNGLPFARRVVAEARALGCTAAMIYEDEGAYVEGVRRGPAEIVGSMGKNEYGMLSGTDAYIFVPGQALGAYSKTLKPEERDRSVRYNSSWYEAAEKAGLRGARLSFGYVGRDMAAFLGKKVQDIVKAQLDAALTDYREIACSAAGVSPRLTDGAEAEITSGHTSIRFAVRGGLTVEDGLVDDQDRKSGDNMAYVPPGFVSKDVDPGSANGRVTLTNSLTRFGVVRRATLEFKDGLLVGWESDDKATIKKLMDLVAPEKRKLTSLLVGLNPALKNGVGADRFVLGNLTLAGFGFAGQVRKGTLKVSGSEAVAEGKLRPLTGAGSTAKQD
jgi:leucyl aminopeptidase (aminopeptidase T)